MYQAKAPDTCQKPDGQLFNPWAFVEARNRYSNGDPAYREYTCAGAFNSAGTWRTGTGCSYRAANQGGTSYHRANISYNGDHRAATYWDSVPAASVFDYQWLHAET